ncbi:hypothetical protein BaRGS_00000734 [Batillaria attramentaria]|uniref:Secreted protein n=1 Tax=Batillaria attramentaria TaxID=370345 RepID=A0ABD0M734_9CAEN
MLRSSARTHTYHILLLWHLLTAEGGCMEDAPRCRHTVRTDHHTRGSVSAEHEEKATIIGKSGQESESATPVQKPTTIICSFGRFLAITQFI